MQAIGRLDHDAITEGLHRGTRCAQHALRVIARRHLLDHGRRTIGTQPSEQDRGLHLGGRNLHHVLNALQSGAAGDGNGRRAVRRLDLGAHRAQRLGDALHRTRADRLVAVEDEYPGRLHGADAGEEAHQRAGVLDVDRANRRLEAVKTDTVDGEATKTVIINLHAERAHRLERGAGVGRITPALDLDGTIAQRADQERTMTHGLVAVDAQLAE